MKRLVEEIREVLPALVAADPAGPGLAEVAKALGASLKDVRAAAVEAKADPSLGIVVIRYKGNKRHLLLADGLGSRDRVCPVCDAHFLRDSRKPKQRFCSRSCGSTFAWRFPETRAKMLQANCKALQTRATSEKWLNSQVRARERRRSPEFREQQSKRSKAAWADPDQRANMIAGLQAATRRPEGRRQRSEIAKKAWCDPAHRETISRKLRRHTSQPEIRQERSARAKAMWRDPEKRASITEKTRSRAGSNGERAAQSARMRAKWADSEGRRVMLGGIAKGIVKRRGVKFKRRSNTVTDGER